MNARGISRGLADPRCAQRSEAIFGPLVGSLASGGSVAIQVLGDSTGDETSGRVYGLATALASKCPANTAKYRLTTRTSPTTPP
ncbi:hypothetical protein EON82_17765 [bacterium]|nr:MAG: hypothetical protein EON82_17765 [bacterium]